MFRYIVAGVVALLLVFFWFIMMPYIHQVPCPNCSGKGTLVGGLQPCPYCDASGNMSVYKRDIVLPEILKKRRAEQEQKFAEEKRAKENEAKWKEEQEQWEREQAVNAARTAPDPATAFESAPSE